MDRRTEINTSLLARLDMSLNDSKSGYDHSIQQGRRKRFHVALWRFWPIWH
jgi:hypothetical protein